MSQQFTNPNQCNHINARGRRCRMLRAPHHDSLCVNHLHQSADVQPDAETLAADLLDHTGDLATTREINALLANVAKQFALQHLDRKDAVAFGYLSQLLLCSLPGSENNVPALREALALSEANKGIAEMQARYAERRAAKAEQAAAKAQEAAAKAQAEAAARKSSPAPTSLSAPEPR